MFDYIIVGAGISGCYLAHKLRGYKILILERSNRIGGRLLSKELDNHVYDLGGMRFSKSSHVLVRAMLDDMGISYIPIDSTIPGSKSMSRMLDNVSCSTDLSQGFVTYSWNHGYNPINMSLKQGYDIFTNDITLRLLYYDNKIIPDWNRVPIGLENVCHMLVDGIDVRLNANVTNITDHSVNIGNEVLLAKNIIFTGQPDSLTILTGIDYISSFIPYNALRIYIPYKSRCDIGVSTKLPLRKIQSIGDALLIYCDSGSSNIVLSLIENKKYDIIARWIMESTGIRLPIRNIRRLIYHYWSSGIFFYRSYAKKIKPNITCINSDISDKPGWMEGSLEMVRDYLNSRTDMNPIQYQCIC